MSQRLVLDATVLVAIDRDERETWPRLRRFIERKGVPIVPTVVVAEAWRDPRQARLARVLSLCRLVDLDPILARRAGELCARSGTRDVLDAVVVVTASREGGYVWSDDPDLPILAEYVAPGARSVEVIRPS